jgi:MSHA biogenesis protein MshJ
MTTQLERWAERIDALSLRERVFLFLSLAVLLMALADQSVISNSMKQQASWNSQVKVEEQALALLRQQLQADAPGAPSEGGARQLAQELTLATQARDQLRELWTAQSGPGVRPAELSDLMGRVLQRHQGVRLVQMATQAGAAAAAPAASATPGTPAVPAWQGAWISVSGPYAELQSFVASLETQLPGLRWGALHLRSEGTQSLLSMQVWLQGNAP